MANLKISELNELNSPSGSDVLAIVNGGETKKIQVNNLVAAGSDTGSFYVDSSVSGTTLSFVRGDGTTDSVNITSSSYSVSASYAISASVEIQRETSSSYADFAVSASYAETSELASTASYFELPENLLSSSAQIASDISGSTGALSASIASDIAELTTTTLISSSAQIASDISGSTGALSASIASDIAELTTATLISSSQQIATDISGAFSLTSASIASDIAELTTTTLISSSAQIATDISGAFSLTSASIATDISDLSSSLNADSASLALDIAQNSQSIVALSSSAASDREKFVRNVDSVSDNEFTVTNGAGVISRITIETGSFIKTVNANGPDASGNVTVSFGTTSTGLSSSFPASPDDADIYIISGETATDRTSSNGEVYIYSSGSSAWFGVTSPDKSANDISYVNVSGDTMTGKLTVDGNLDPAIEIKAPATNEPTLAFNQDAVATSKLFVEATAPYALKYTDSTKTVARNIKAADPIDSDDLTTKTYVDAAVYAIPVMFSGTGTGTSGNVTPGTKLQFTADVDTDSGWSTDTYTVPEDGVYEIFTSLRVQINTADKRTAIYKGANHIRIIESPGKAPSSPYNSRTLVGHIIAPFVTGDQISVGAFQTTTNYPHVLENGLSIRKIRN